MIEMRTSERGALKRCAQQWYWSTVEGLAPKHAASPLWFGSAVHEALAKWYLPGLDRGPDLWDTFDEYLEGDRSIPLYNEDDQAEYVSARELGKAMLHNYFDTFGRDETWDVLFTEHTAQVRLPRKARTVFGKLRLPYVRAGIRYVMTFDGVYRDLATGEIWLMEHKTAASIRVDHLPLDDQAGSYWAFASSILRKRGVLKEGEEIAGIMYNFLRKAELDDRPKNARGVYTNKPTKAHYVEALTAKGVGPVAGKPLDKVSVADLEALAAATQTVVLGEESKNQPPPYFERVPVYRSRAERAVMLSRIQDEAFYAAAYRDGSLPVTKAPNLFTCQSCPFKAMCVLHEQGDMEAVEDFKATMYTRRDPYAAHQKKSA